MDLSNIKDMVKSIGLLVNEMDQRKQNEQVENDQKPQPVNKKVTVFRDYDSAHIRLLIF